MQTVNTILQRYAAAQQRPKSETGNDYRFYNKYDFADLTHNYNSDGGKDTFAQERREAAKTIAQLVREPEFLVTVACFAVSIYIFFTYFYRYLKGARDSNRTRKAKEEKQKQARAYWKDMNEKAEARRERLGIAAPPRNATADDGAGSTTEDDGDLVPPHLLPDDRMTFLKRETRRMAAIVDRYKEKTSALEANMMARYRTRRNGREAEEGPLPPMAGCCDDTTATTAFATPARSTCGGGLLGTVASEADLLASSTSLPSTMPSYAPSPVGGSSPVDEAVVRRQIASAGQSDVTPARATKPTATMLDDATANGGGAATRTPSRLSPDRGAYIVNGRTTKALSSDVFGYSDMTAAEQLSHEDTFRRVERKVLAARQEKATADRKKAHATRAADSTKNNKPQHTDGNGGSSSEEAKAAERARLIAEAEAREEEESKFLSTFLTPTEHQFWEDNMKKIRTFHKILKQEAAYQWERRRELVAQMVALEEQQKDGSSSSSGSDGDCEDSGNNDHATPQRKNEIPDDDGDDGEGDDSYHGGAKVRRMLNAFESGAMKPTEVLRR